MSISESQTQVVWEKNRDPAGLLRKTRCFFLDLDGTLYLGDRWIDGALDFLDGIRQKGKKFVLLTNNSSRGSKAYFERLAEMGLSIRREELATSGDATIHYLLREMSGKGVFLMGNRSLREDFARWGVLLDEETPQVVVLAFDTEFDYAKLVKLCDFVRQGKPYVATHPDLNCPTKQGVVPDLGALLAYVEASTGRKPDLVVGKPNGEIMAYAMKLANTQKEESAMVGDRLYTDILAGVNNGLLSVCVLSGESNLKEVIRSCPQPHLVFDSVREMIPFI
ncbi:MAG: HAD-IIA family hydrolase [Synergistaceae bacterium]|nr:HAD-IIA family hydrolase [Synergistaceae bacterium]